MELVSGKRRISATLMPHCEVLFSFFDLQQFLYDFWDSELRAKNYFKFKMYKMRVTENAIFVKRLRGSESGCSRSSESVPMSLSSPSL